MNPDAKTLWTAPRWALAILLASLGMLGDLNLAEPQALFGFAGTRGYRPIELTSVMFRELDRLIEKRQRNESLTTRVISFDEIDLWARTSADGWATEHEGLADFMFSFGRIGAQCKGAFPYLAELDGNPISTGSVFI